MQLPRDQQIADEIIERDGSDEQQHELPIAKGVKGQRRQRQPDHRRQIAEPAESEIAEQNRRQKQENERIGIEEHRAFLKERPKSLTTQLDGQQPCVPAAAHLWQSARSNRYKGSLLPFPACGVR
jgi:hypothetical protein